MDRLERVAVVEEATINQLVSAGVVKLHCRETTDSLALPVVGVVEVVEKANGEAMKCRLVGTESSSGRRCWAVWG
jgi:hypothetical protein